MQTYLTLSAQRRLWPYLRERFPLHVHGPLIAMLVWALAACAGGAGFAQILPAVLVLTGFFFQVRVFDEHKDAAIDAAWRRELPVPRGLITLAELRRVAWFVLLVQGVLHAVWLREQAPWFVLLAGFLLVMGREFFLGDRLRANLLLYGATHMLLLPLVAFYAATLSGRPAGELFGRCWPALVAVYFAGFALEIGRKLRAPEGERPGVETYSAVYGPARATMLWLAAVVLGGWFALLALDRAGAPTSFFCLLLFAAFLVAFPALRFIEQPEATLAKRVEQAAGWWMLTQLALLGAAGWLTAP
jgi:hypothetical protein